MITTLARFASGNVLIPRELIRIYPIILAAQYTVQLEMGWRHGNIFPLSEKCFIRGRCGKSCRLDLITDPYGPILSGDGIQ